MSAIIGRLVICNFLVKHTIKTLFFSTLIFYLIANKKRYAIVYVIILYYLFNYFILFYYNILFYYI